MAKPGKMDQRITLEQLSLVSDGGGGSTKTWAGLSVAPIVWAHVKANGGRETFDDDRTNATATTTFTIRNRDDVQENDRIVWRSEFYNIRHVMRQGTRDMYLRIVAERGAPIQAGVETLNQFSSAFSEAFA